MQLQQHKDMTSPKSVPHQPHHLQLSWKCRRHQLGSVLLAHSISTTGEQIRNLKPPPVEVCDLQSTMNQEHQTQEEDHISKAADMAAALLLQAGTQSDTDSLRLSIQNDPQHCPHNAECKELIQYPGTSVPKAVFQRRAAIRLHTLFQHWAETGRSHPRAPLPAANRV